MKLSVVLISAICLSPMSAFAHKACHDDMKKLCADVKAGEGRVHKCMEEHEADLSATCKADIAAHKAEAHAWKEACAADRESLCKDVKQGNGRVAACMHDNEAKLSAGCKAGWKTFKKKWGEVHTACAADLKTHCKSVKAGHGGKMACLETHAAELAPACKDAIDDVD